MLGGDAPQTVLVGPTPQGRNLVERVPAFQNRAHAKTSRDTNPQSARRRTGRVRGAGVRQPRQLTATEGKWFP